MIRSSRAALLLMALAAAAAACSPDFDEVWQVKDLRLLAIQADPPEVLASTVITSFPRVTITALAVDPSDPGRLVDWELWACTADETSCEEAALSVRVARRRTRLNQITAGLTLSPGLFAAALEEDPLKGFGGLAVLMELRIRDTETRIISGVKRVVFGLTIPLSLEALSQGQAGALKLPPAADGAWAGACKTATPACDPGLDCLQGRCLKRPNQNPTISGVTVDKQAVGSSWTVSAGEELPLLPASPGADKQPYVVQTFTGGSKQLEEYLTYNFFATSGDLSNPNTGGKPSFIVDNKKTTDLTSDWTPEDLSKAASQQATVWIVVHDDRGGVGWTELSAQVQPPKP